MVKRILGFSLVLCVAMFLSCDTDNVFDEEEQLRNDVALIERYISDNNINAFAFDNGIHIAVQNQGSGSNARFGDSVIFHYRGYLLDGTEFETTEGRAPWDIVVGRGDNVSAWNFAFRELNAGTIATIFVPSGLGFGNNRRTNVPPNSVLIYDVTILDIR